MSTFTDSTDGLFGNESSCFYGEKYINFMHKSKEDTLFDEDIFSADNCQYILIRKPASTLSFYSISDSVIIHKWEINENNDNIWTINDNFINAQTLSISNGGCLTFTDNDDTIISQIGNNCDSSPISISDPEVFNNTETLIFDELYSSLSATDLHQNNNDAFYIEQDGVGDQLTNLQIWLPISLCILGVICAIIVLIINVLFKTTKFGDIDSNGSGETNDSIITTETDENIANNNNNNDVMDDEEELMYDEDIDINLNNNDEFELEDHRAISQDMFVTQRIISIATPWNRNDIPSSNDMYINDGTSDLIVPNATIGSGTGGSSGSDMSDLDTNIHHNTDTKIELLRIEEKLNMIQSIDVECIRNKTVEQESSSGSSSDEGEEDVL